MPDDRPTSHNLLDLAPPDIAWFQERSDLILIPIGSCEQHGAHLPLGTDTITALEVSRRAAEKADVPYAPPFWAGYSPQHLRETESGVGTITLRASTLNEVLYDIARSLIHHGWNKLVFVNGHGSNTKVIDPLLRRIKYDTGAFVALYKPYAERYIGMLDGLLENPPDETPGWHASELETSQVMAHDASLVKMEHAAEDRAQVPRLAAGLVHQEGRRARRRVRRLPVLRLPDGPRRVLAHGRDRQPDARHAGEGRGGAQPLRRPPRPGDRRVPPARGLRDPAGSSRSASEHRAAPHCAEPRSSSASSATAACPSPIWRATTRSRRSRCTATSRSSRARAWSSGCTAARGRSARRPARRRSRRRGRSAPTRRGAAKAAIAAHAARYVGHGATIFLDASSTALALARRLVEDPPNELTLVTNSPAIAYEMQAERDPRRRRARRARPAHAHARRPLDGRVPVRAELRGRVRLGRRASRSTRD